MTAETIQILADTIPDHLMPHQLLGGRSCNVPSLGYDASVHRFVTRYRQPDFGWVYARLTAEFPSKVPLTGGLMLGADEVLLRAHLFARSPRVFPSPDIQGALALNTSDMAATRHMVRGLLLGHGATVVSVAAASSLPVSVIAAYERLFFNVLDRKADIAYLQSIVYPHGRLVEMMEGYLQNTPLGELIMRAGYNNGADDVMYLLGGASSALDALTKAGSAKTLEQLMMTYGYILARNGGLNQRDATGMNNARALLTAGKIGGVEADDRPLSDDFSTVLGSELKQYAKPATYVLDV